MKLMFLFKRLYKKLVRIYYVQILDDKVTLARKLGAKVGGNCNLYGDPAKLLGTEPWLVTIGDHVMVNQDVKLLTHEGGNWVAAGMNPDWKKYDLFAPIVIGNNVMIGMRSIIMKGVTIGDNVIIGANSVVTKNVPSGTIWGGIPAKQIGTIDKFIDKLIDFDCPTVGKPSLEKKKVLERKYPEWF